MTYAESGLFWSQCFLPSLVIRKAQAGAGKSSLGLLCTVGQYWLIIKINGTNPVNFVGNSVIFCIFVGNMLSNRNFS